MASIEAELPYLSMKSRSRNNPGLSGDIKDLYKILEYSFECTQNLFYSVF